MSFDNRNLPYIPDDVIIDLICRFTSNIPEEEQNDLIRMCFQVELAHWFFVDKYCTRTGARLVHLAHIPFLHFAAVMFRHTPILKQHLPYMDQIVCNFKDYKQKVPTFGAILLNADMDQVLLVQGFGNSWGFPKGKVNQDEDLVICAIREVEEETGYCIESLINPNHYIESVSPKDRKERLYIVVGADTDFDFKPSTLYEIRQIAWFGLDELPENKKDENVVSTRGYSNGNFFTIFPYVRRLKKWILDKQSGENQIQCFRCAASTECNFPYPYPMGFIGGTQNERTNLYGPFPYLVPESNKRQAALEELEHSLEPASTPTETRYKNIGVPVTKQNKPKCELIELPDLKISPSKNPKRRLFLEDIENEDFSSDQISNRSFLDGPGAQAWLNFKLDLHWAGFPPPLMRC